MAYYNGRLKQLCSVCQKEYFRNNLIFSKCQNCDYLGDYE